MKVSDALGLVLTGLMNSQYLLAAAQKAQSEGRDELSDAEVAEFRGRDDQASQRLQAEIDKQKASQGKAGEVPPGSGG